MRRRDGMPVGAGLMAQVRQMVQGRCGALAARLTDLLR
jgi:hypothetical protein